MAGDGASLLGLEESKPEISFKVIKNDLKNKKLASLDCEELTKYCNKLQLKTTGTKTELVKRLNPLKDEKLFQKRVEQISKQYKFRTSLSRENVPPPTAGWKFDKSLFPKITEEQIESYQSAKRQGKKGQYRKALRMFQSRRMKTIKALKTGRCELFIKASVLKSFTSDVTRPVTVKFDDNIPTKAFCECSIGACGLCCHAILVLLQLKYFTQHDKLILALTCTQKLQTWHRSNKTTTKDNAKIKTASHIKLKYFRNARSVRKTLKHTRSKKKIQDIKDVDRSDWLSRDVSEISSKVESTLKKSNYNVSNHFLETLRKYKITNSGLYNHLSYKNAYSCKVIQQDHNYAHTEIFDDKVLAPRFPDSKTDDIWHSVLDPAKTQETRSISDAHCNSNCSVFSKEKTEELLSLISHSTQQGTINIKLPKHEDLESFGSNHVNVVQGSKEWLACRVGIITASKLPALLGLCGHKEFESSWFCIKNKLDESLHKPKKFKNYTRGNFHEREALDNFTAVSGIPISSCGFFKHPMYANYGASPDGITQSFAVEVKTRAENSMEPLEKITGSHLVQTNFQMSCTGGQITFLQSYLPEKKVSNFFYIPRNDLLINVIKDITDHILQDKIFIDWHYDEHPSLSKLGKDLLGSTAIFERLRHLRSWINCLAKDAKRVIFL